MRERMEADPMHFFTNDLEALLDEARRRLATFLDADAEALAFVPNATAGVNAVLRSLTLSPGDELLTTSHAYGAVKKALLYVSERSGARVVAAEIPFPLGSPQDAIEPILRAVSDK